MGGGDLTKELGFKPRPKAYGPLTRLGRLCVIIDLEFRQLGYGATLAQARIWEFIPVVGVMASPTTVTQAWCSGC